VFLSYKKKYLRYFDVKTSSAHEGTNFGLKEHAAAVLPSQRINVAAKNLSLQSSMKGAQLESESTHMASSQSLWSQSPTANHVTTLAESIISRACRRTHDYAPRRTAIDSWEVHYVGAGDYALETDREPANKNSPIPIFMRVRVVILRSGFLCCDCGGQQRIGLTCVHTMTVMESCFPDWKGPTHHDVSPRWWVIWVEFAHKPKNQTLTSALLALMENEVPGPRVPGLVPIPPADAYFPVTDTKTAVNRVKNYSREQLDRLVPSHRVIQERNAQRTIITDEGFTQESYIVCHDSLEDDEEKDNIFASSDNEENPFANSLVLDDLFPLAMASARDILKPQMNEVLQCLDVLKSQKSIEKATTVLNNLVNDLRLELGSARKRNIENCLTVNMNVEENVSRKSRSFASRNC
jgi:hypothetical protein